MKLYTGLNAQCDGALSGVEGLHVTTMYGGVVPCARFETTNLTEYAIIADVQYWERVGLTVLILESELAVARNKYFTDLGFKYDYEYIPHVTIAQGDCAEEYMSMVGNSVYLHDEYVRIV